MKVKLISIVLWLVFIKINLYITISMGKLACWALLFYRAVGWSRKLSKI